MTPEQINKAAEDEFIKYLERNKLDYYNQRDEWKEDTPPWRMYTALASEYILIQDYYKKWIPHSRQEIEELKAELNNQRGRINRLLSIESDLKADKAELKAENDKLREALKMCLNYMDATSIKKGYMKIDEIETARKLLEG